MLFAKNACLSLLLLGFMAIALSDMAVGQDGRAIQIAERQRRQETILDQQIRVRYQRAHLGEVLYELQYGQGLESAYPKVIDEQLTFTLPLSTVTVRTILDSMAEQLGLTWESRDGFVVFWRPLADDEFHTLNAKARDLEAPDRAIALEKLAFSGDRRAYATLFWAMAEGSEPMAMAALHWLSIHHMSSYHTSTLRFGEDHDLLAQGVKRLLATRTEHLEILNLLYLAGNSCSPACGALLLPYLDELPFSGPALIGLTNCADPATVKPLVERMKEAPDPDPNLDTGYIPLSNLNYLFALGDMGLPEAARAIRTVAAESDNRDDLLEIARALCRSGDDAGFALIDRLLNDEEIPDGPARFTRGRGGNASGAPAAPLPFPIRCANYLGQSGDARAMPILVGLLDESDPYLADAAVQALLKICDRRIGPIALILMKNPNTAKRGLVLSRFADQDEVNKLKEGIEIEEVDWREQEEPYRYYTLQQLARMGDQEALDEFVARLEVRDGSRTPRDAADALGRLRELSTMEALFAAIDNEEVNARHAAAAAIANMRHPDAVKFVIKKLQSSEAQVRENAVDVLWLMKSPDAVPALAEVLDDLDREQRILAVKTLVMTDTPEALKAASRVLDDEDRDMRLGMFRSLEYTTKPASVPLLRKLMEEEDYLGNAVAGILNSRDVEAIRDLVASAEPARSSSRQWSGYSLDPIYRMRPYHDFCALDVLCQLTRDPDPRLREKAVGKLPALSAAVPTILAALEDEDDAVRSVARRRLSDYRSDPRVLALIEE